MTTMVALLPEDSPLFSAPFKYYCSIFFMVLANAYGILSGNEGSFPRYRWK